MKENITPQPKKAEKRLFIKNLEDLKAKSEEESRAKVIELPFRYPYQQQVVDEDGNNASFEDELILTHEDEAMKGATMILSAINCIQRKLDLMSTLHQSKFALDLHFQMNQAFVYARNNMKTVALGAGHTDLVKKIVETNPLK